MERYFS